MKYKIDRYANIVNVVLFAKASIHSKSQLIDSRRRLGRGGGEERAALWIRYCD